MEASQLPWAVLTGRDRSRLSLKFLVKFVFVYMRGGLEIFHINKLKRPLRKINRRMSARTRPPGGFGKLP